MQRRLLRASLVPCLLWSFACLDDVVPTPTTPLSFCQDNARIDCRVLFECFDATMRAAALTELGATWTSQADCVADRLSQCEAEPAACEPGQIFQEQKAAACANARRALKCSDWLNQQRAEPAACETCEMIGPQECIGHRISYCTGEPRP